MFTGDRSGDWLYGELHRQGLASGPTSTSREDGLTLEGVYVTAAGRCAPPKNKPEPVELDRCREYLVRERSALTHVRVILALGAIAFQSVLKARLEARMPNLTPKPAFAHAARTSLPEGGWLLASYHPSQQNTSTGRLTASMWHAIFGTAKLLRDRV